MIYHTITLEEGLRTFKYDYSSIRRTYYTYDANGNPIYERRVSNINSNDCDYLRYFYDETGITGFGYYAAGTTWLYYNYGKNLQGDIVAIYDASGNKVVTYTYDAWGVCTIESDVSGKSLGTKNPFRYRGYYYDAETGLYYLQSRYYDPSVGRFISPDDYSLLGANGDLLSCNLYVYCSNNPVAGYDPAGTLDCGAMFKGIGWLISGGIAIFVGVSVLICGVATLAMMAVATVTAVSGLATTVNGVSEIVGSFTGHNFIRDYVFHGNASAYNVYAHLTASVSAIGTMICGGWLNANAPRIEAYNNIHNYTYANGAAKHVGERSYYDSILLRKAIIKYGTMTNEGGGVYTFRAAGTAFSNVQQTFQRGIWELTTINGKRLIGHFLLRS